MKRTLLTLGFALLIGHVVLAQIPSTMDFSRASNAAYFKYTRTGDVSVIINMWGTVRHPGRYELTKGSDLGDAVSLGGGPSDSGERPDEFERAITVTLARKSLAGREVIFQSELSQIVESRANLPVLLDDDVIYINTVSKSKANFRTVYLPVANILATGLLIALRIIDISRTP